MHVGKEGHGSIIIYHVTVVERIIIYYVFTVYVFSIMMRDNIVVAIYNNVAAHA